MGLACCCGFPPNSQALLKGWTRPIGWCLWRANPQKTSNSKKKHTVSDGISVFFLESSFVHVHTPNAPAAAATSTVVEAKQLPQTCSKAWTCSSCFNEQGELQEKELCQHIKKHTHTHPSGGRWANLLISILGNIFRSYENPRLDCIHPIKLHRPEFLHYLNCETKLGPKLQRNWTGV